MPQKHRLVGLVAACLTSSCSDDVVATSPASDGGGGSSTLSDPAPTTSTTAADLPTTSEPTTSDTSTTEEIIGPEGPLCGDGEIGGLEECDDGEQNSVSGACTPGCKLAVCGDGLVNAGAEDCDFGPANDDSYGGCLDCKFGPRCGDDEIQTEYEECDHGPLNGSGLPKNGMAPCDLTCTYRGRLMFITNAQFSGNLGGVSGADLKCQTAASVAGLPQPHTYRAWISDDSQSPKSRFEQWDQPDVPLYLPGGRLVALDIADLVDNGPDTGISRTETGVYLVNRPVWTNTSAFGDTFDITHHCDGWLVSSVDLQARRGYNALDNEDGLNWVNWLKDRLWTSSGNLKCNKLAHLYCIEDG